MKYLNPVIRGFYPDPSVCYAGDRYYLVCSSFQYFPGVPLFESTDLVNWKQTGHVLTRPDQVKLQNAWSSGGVFAPTIRCNDGILYVITNNNSTGENFYVSRALSDTEWSSPVTVMQDGIDPSLLFDGGHCYFISNGTADDGEGGIVQCEIDIATGRKLSPARCIWKGTGGRYLESPHMYKLGDEYYLMAAEGGTEYGHMITLARSESVWGPFISCRNNPVLTNRDKAPFPIQGIGHGDLIEGPDGNLYILCLGFRQIGKWLAYHHLGREVFLIPAYLDEEGLLHAGKDGTADFEYEIPGDGVQQIKKRFTFADTDPGLDWCFIRHPVRENYSFSPDKWILRGTDITIDMPKNPTFAGLRQREPEGSVSVRVRIEGTGRAGITLLMNEDEHYDLFIKTEEDTGPRAVLRLNIGEAKYDACSVYLEDFSAVFKISFDSERYYFSVVSGGTETKLGSARTKYLSTEVSGGFTGVMTGLFAENAAGEFTDFECIYT